MYANYSERGSSALIDPLCKAILCKGAPAPVSHIIAYNFGNAVERRLRKLKRRDVASIFSNETSLAGQTPLFEPRPFRRAPHYWSVLSALNTCVVTRRRKARMPGHYTFGCFLPMIAASDRVGLSTRQDRVMQRIGYATLSLGLIALSAWSVFASLTLAPMRIVPNVPLIPAWLVFATGPVCAAAGTLVLLLVIQGGAFSSGDRKRVIVFGNYRAIAIFLFGACMVGSALAGEIHLLTAAIVFLFGIIGMIAAMQIIDSLGAGDTFEIQSHWGGLGSGMGGWRLSPVTSLAIIVLVFLGAAALSVELNVPTTPPSQPDHKQAAPQAPAAP